MGSGSKSKKKETIDMGNYTAKDEETKALLWCINNNIKITPTAVSSKEWYLDIIINGRTNRSPVTYEKIEIWKQLYKFYLYYYNKHHKVEVVIEDIKKPIVEKQIKEKPKPPQQQELF
jgi:hypothetical protein